jgi:serine protease Do
MLDRFRQSKNVGLIGIASLLSVLMGVGIGSTIQHFYPISQPAQAANYSPPQTQSLPDFVSLVKKVGPAVVNISTTQVRKSAEYVPSPFGDQDPFNDFWQRFFGGRMPRGTQRQRGLGSGFIIDRDGTILTNYHVVDGAQKIVVTLADGRSFDGKVLGKDQKTDIAIVKIDSHQDLPVVTLGDSDQLQVGEWVLAIGDPFGLDHTVTSGIVSAKGRQIGAGPYDNFIQTDASINPGNSGGPLLNMRGEVVGINSAIFSQSGGNIGIGFAIPTNLVKGELPQLKSKGKIVRGYLGTVIQRITPELADSLGLKSPHGALVAETTKDGPAARAGIRAGDVIVEFNGKEIKDSSDLPLEVASVTPGTTVQMKVLRDSKEMTLPITVGEMKENEVAASTEEEGDFGLAVQTVTPEVADSLGLGRVEGVVVNSVKPGSAADEAGLQRGDVITQVNRHPIHNVADYNREMEKTGKGKSLLLLVKRGDGSLFLALKR